MQDKRKLKRNVMQYNLEIHDAGTDEVAGWLVDINAEGLKISGDRTFDKNKRLALAIRLPEEISGKTAIPFSAKVRWCKPDENQQLTATGLQFEKISTEDYETLVGFMTQYAMMD